MRQCSRRCRDGSPSSGQIQQQILARVAANLLTLDEALSGTTVSRLAGEGGWYAVLRTPALTHDDETFAVSLLEQTGVLVHPGAAFGFSSRGWLVISLLPVAAVFSEAIARLLRNLTQLVEAARIAAAG